LLDQDFSDGPMNEVKLSIPPEYRGNPHFIQGLKDGYNDKLKGDKRDVSDEHPDYVAGYKTVAQESWWTKFNDRLTHLATQLGHSYGSKR